MDASLVLDIAIFFVLFTNILICPYTKVEESFNLQATHDILYHGLNISMYDHLQFPGVVPRTFIGPLFIALLSSPLVVTLHMMSVAKIYSQLVVRGILGICCLASFRLFRHGVRQKFGPTVANFLSIITITQFHLIFYMSRPLPNIFALVLVLAAFYFWFSGNDPAFIWCSGYSIIIFRAELALLMGIIILFELYHKRISFPAVFLHAVCAGITSLALTVIIDSFFWQRWCWPEAEVFWYNTVLNKSSNWGTSPFLWYFYSALPRALSLFTPFLIAYGLKYDARTRIVFSVTLAFVFLFSFLPHKELRFVLYVVPLMNTVAAVGLNSIYQNILKWKVEIRNIFTVFVFGGLLSNVVITNILLYVSSLNYPGGLAFTRLHHHLQDSTGSVHICNLAAQTGVSRFGELRNDWRYLKKENIEQNLEELEKFTHLIVEAPCEIFENTHKMLEEIYGFGGISLETRDNFPYFSVVKMIPKLCILEKV
ncbi:dol-P-Man:Man(7)GlcNAc(2)-PP-Dol alpha-1,6-mannosyltransferase-like [Dendronephthya gigantea]|uniref:dol-P-Man:Man(7)GlcNAc(2)-PP-Dol alpha-1,6-mannosyltransferase-like n=1 Tax=Dendronephthya gigantea TaxID=151771 RepID=UPI00106C5F61|nr:dol-P-Man:Man(7)GlcNAc(2)-PP-Dol alpha-1,6-mannosyltransferase-like [Dendronephthya gigantea]